MLVSVHESSRRSLGCFRFYEGSVLSEGWRLSEILVQNPLCGVFPTWPTKIDSSVSSVVETYLDRLSLFTVDIVDTVDVIKDSAIGALRLA